MPRNQIRPTKKSGADRLPKRLGTINKNRLSRGANNTKRKKKKNLKIKEGKLRKNGKGYRGRKIRTTGQLGRKYCPPWKEKPKGKRKKIKALHGD